MPKISKSINYSWRALGNLANTLTVNGMTLDGRPLNMWIVVQQNGATVKSGFTPLTFTGVTGGTYTVIASDYDAGGVLFDHWGNGSTSKARSATLNADMWFDARYRLVFNLTVRSTDLSGNAISGYYTTIQAGGTAAGSGFTPCTFACNSGTTYAVTPNDYGSVMFDHWEDGSKTRTRLLVINSERVVTAYYKTLSTSISSIIPKTGVFVALYMNPVSGSVHWQKVIDEKYAHWSVPVATVFNPSSGPGGTKDANFADWVVKLRNAGVIALGYTYDGYGTRPLTELKADADKYKNWYNADGIFIDEFTNKVGFENHYLDITAYAKSIGMKMTMGNPGTDVPKSYIGTVDVLNITEGPGYMPISWLQYCVQCSPNQGWHYQYDKRNFSYIRYNISSLDTSFEVESKKWVGLLYITDGNDADGRWFHVPPYFGTLMGALDV
jgi:hypothetical protein